MAATIKRSKQNDGGSDSEMYDDCPLIDEKKRAAMDSHCEIERRRRNKMVSLVNELSDIVPACNSYDKRKPDKLTILKLAVDHLRSLKGFPVEDDVEDASNDNKSSFLTDSELKKLVLEATSGFLFVVICATGKVIYVSDTVAEVLGVSKDEWDDANMYNIIHPEDRSLLTRQLKVEEHELQHGDDNTQATSGLEANLASDLCRRSFIMKMKTSRRREEDKEVVVTGEDGTKYVVVHVTGYIRHWPTAPEHYSQPCFNSQSCLIAIGHCKQKFLCDEPGPANKQDSFLARHKMSGMFTFVDGRVTNVLGYKTGDLLQRSIYEFCHESDQYLIEEAFKQVLDKKDQVVNATFRFLNSSGNFTSLRLSCSAFLNPFSEVVEYISATYTTFAAHPCNQTPKFNKLNNFEMNNNRHLTNSNSINNKNKQQNSFLKNQSFPQEHVSSECGSYSQTFGAVVEPSINSCNIQKPLQQTQLSQNQPLHKHHLQQLQHHQQQPQHHQQQQSHHQQQLQHHLQQPQHPQQQPHQQPQHHQQQQQPQHHQQQTHHQQQQPQHQQQHQQQPQHHPQQPQHQPQHRQQIMTSSTHGFNLVPTQSSLPLYDQNTRWLNHQINKKFERNSNAPPPDYDHHLNMFQPPEPGNYQHLESGINNLEYHWTSRLTNQMPVIESETFVDAGNFMNNSTSDATTTTTWHASNYPYDYDMWQNDNNEDMSEVMNILTASSSSSNLFNSADENLIKKFCS